jgi:hypothetical protein
MRWSRRCARDITDGIVPPQRSLDITDGLVPPQRSLDIIDGLVPPQRSLEARQYQDICYTDRLAAAGVESSAGSVGDAYDSALARSWRRRNGRGNCDGGLPLLDTLAARKL